MGIKKEPFKREFLVEAVAIASGGAYKVIKKEHVVALYEAYMAVCAQHSTLKDQLKNIAAAAIRMRASQGLSTSPPKEIK